MTNGQPYGEAEEAALAAEIAASQAQRRAQVLRIVDESNTNGVVDTDAVLAALEGETRYEWAYRSTWPDGSDHVMSCHTEGEARAMAAGAPSGPGITRRLVRRTVYTGRWTDAS